MSKSWLDMFRFPFEDDDLVRARSSHQARRIRPARPFTQNLDIAPDQTLVRAVRRRIDNAQQVLIALLFHALVDLRHRRGRRVAANGIAEDERVIELDLLDQIARPPVIVFLFAGKTDDHIGRDCDFVTRLPDAIDQRAIFLGGVGPMHRLQDAIRARIGAGDERARRVSADRPAPG